MDTVGEGESGMNGESSINTCALLGVRWTAGEKLPCSTGSPVWCSVMGWRDRMGAGEGAKEGREVWVITPDLHCCMAETNTTL